MAQENPLKNGFIELYEVIKIPPCHRRLGQSEIDHGVK